MSDVAETVAWLRAQVEADKTAAEAASPGPWFPNDECDEVMSEGLCGGDDTMVCEGFALSGPQLRATVRHIVLHDPDDVIADADAKLAVLDHYRQLCDLLDPVTSGKQEYILAEGAVGRAVTLLAQGYRHRAGWKEEWTT